MVKKLLCIENVFLSFSSQQIILVSGEHREISYAKGKITTRGISMGVHDKKKKKEGWGRGGAQAGRGKCQRFSGVAPCLLL